MRFLDRCRVLSLDPFDPASRELHEAAQRREARERQRARYNLDNPGSRWLSTLRQLNEAHEDAMRRARQWRQRAGELLLSADRESRRMAELNERELSQAAEAAAHAYRTHGAEHPELFAEFELRLELRDLEREEQTLIPRAAFAERMTKTAPPELPAPDTLAQVQAQAALATTRALARTAEADAAEAGRFYEALTGATPVDMDACNRARRELERLQTRARRAQSRVDDAELQAQRAAEADARALAEAQTARARHAHHVAMAAQLASELEANRQRQADIRAALPDPPRAPLRRAYRQTGQARRPRTTRGPAVPDALLADTLRDEIAAIERQARSADERTHGTLHRRLRAAQRRLARLTCEDLA